MDVRVDGAQECDAQIVAGPNGRPVLVLRRGLVSSRAFTALVVTLAPVAAAIAGEVTKGQQYLQNAG